MVPMLDLLQQQQNIWSNLTFSGVRGWVKQKSSFWRFAWQISYGCCPLTSACGKSYIFWDCERLLFWLASRRTVFQIITYHTNNLQTSNKLLREWKWPCIKDFIIIFVIQFWSLFALLFQKLKKVPCFWKKKKKKNEYLV